MLKIGKRNGKNVILYNSNDDLINGFFTIAQTMLQKTDHVKRLTLADRLKEIVDSAFYQIEEGVGVK
jgi:hypothetical protein